MFVKVQKIIDIVATPNELRGVAAKIERRIQDGSIKKSGVYYEKFHSDHNLIVRIAFSV